MKIGIMGTRGIPNSYGGFEQFAEYLSVGLVNKGHEVSVYNSSLHSYEQDSWRGVNIIKCKDSEDRWGTAGQFMYDFRCIRDSARREFDLLLHLGYTSDAVWRRLWPKKMVHVINMDGLEWKRTKYNWATRLFLKRVEALAVRSGHPLIADSPGIQEYLRSAYGLQSTYIPYGATPFRAPDPAKVLALGLAPGSYDLVIARMGPENNIEPVIRGYLKETRDKQLVLVGSVHNRYGQHLAKSFSHPSVKFMGGIYDGAVLDNLRYHCSLYFHGHSVGGTNPSLLEAMACGSRIAAHENIFNRAVLADNAVYFNDEKDIAAILSAHVNLAQVQEQRENNLQRVRLEYNWDRVIDQYETLMLGLVAGRL
jgi:glycosyltransferase involved in cell wall biosynthesis